MHRKQIRRWPKLLSAASIIAALFGAMFVAQANAATTTDGTITVRASEAVSSSDYLLFFIDESLTTTGFSASDIEVFGQSCYLYGFYLSAPNHLAYVTGCQDGTTVSIRLKAASAVGSDGVSYPAFDLFSESTFIDRIAPTPSWSGPTLSASANPVFKLTTNELVRTPNFNDYYLAGTATGCSFNVSTIVTGREWDFEITGCSGGDIAMVLPTGGVMDNQWNSGPIWPLQSASATIAAPLVESTPTTSATVAADSTPTASPEPTPTSTPEPTPTPSASPTEAAVVVTPVETPAPPAPPAAAEPVPQPAPQPAPQPVPEPLPEQVSTVAPELPGAVLDWFDETQTEPRPAALTPAVIQPMTPIEPEPVSNQQESKTELPAIKPVRISENREFDWRPIGQFAIAFSGVLAAVGAAVTVRMKITRRRFSPRLI